MPRGRTGTGGPKEGHRREPSELAPVAPSPTQPDLPAPPPMLDESLHDGWYVIVEDLANRGRNPAALQPADLILIYQLLEQVWVHQQATEILRIEGTMIYRKAEILDEMRCPTGEFMTLDAKAHPAVKIQRDAMLAILRVSDRLGLTPMARVQAGLMLVATKSLAEQMGEQIAKIIAQESARAALPVAKATAKPRTRKPPAKPVDTKAKPAPAKKPPAKKKPSSS